MNMKILLACCLGILITLSLVSCATTEVKTAQVINIEHESGDIPESELLDVGIRIFNPGLEQFDQTDEDDIIFPEIRIAESSYFPYLLMAALQSSSAWGAVRVIPASHDSVDVLINGKIMLSDGEELIIAIDVVDAVGNRWFNKEYRHVASRYSYTTKALSRNEPFQTLYNQIANDLNSYRKTMSSAQLIKLRRVAELKFAKSFAPQVFSQHLSVDSSGHYSVNRLPAEQDPMMARIRQVRERDYIFVDTLQQYYDGYAKEMAKPYQQWRRESYSEVIAMRNLKRKARNQKILGAVAIIAGIAGASSNNASGRAAGAIGVTGGAYIIKDGFDRDAESQIHVEALQELGESLEANIQPHVVELEDRTVTLTGTVNNQYQQWRKILQDIYQINIGNNPGRQPVAPEEQH